MRSYEPNPMVSVYRGDDVARMEQNLGAAASTVTVPLGHFAGDWGLGEGDWTAYLTPHRDWDLIDITISCRHSHNVPIGSSPSILEVMPMEIGTEQARTLAEAILAAIDER